MTANSWILSLLFLAMMSWSPAAEASLDESRLELTVLDQGMPRPLELDVAPDGRVFFIELAGKLKIHDPAGGLTTVAGTLEVFTDQENGLLGLALDPRFADNHWLYLMYSTPTETFCGHRVSRFTMKDGQLDPDSEKILLKIPVQRDVCCHHAGSLEFGPEGHLFIATGDNTHPFGDSGSYAPLDERPGRHGYDAQDSSGNTADLRGKILRIKPTPEGGHTIPEGNLFPTDGALKGCPEIYVMGCRNPWRINLDPLTGFLYWGEVGPDARQDGPRGPRGYDELNQARAAGNFGWPFFIGDNFAYADHDYATGKTGPFYDPEAPRNIAPANTGSELLPPAQPAWIYYPYASSEKFPMLGSGGRTACSGPVYRFDPDLDSPTKFPRSFDGHLIFFDWQRPFVKNVALDADSQIKSIEPFLESVPFKRPVDMKFGPDGSLYAIDYGSSWGDNEDSRLLRLDYFAGNRPPVARLTTSTPTTGRQPLTVTLAGSESFDKDAGDTLSYHWSVSPGAFRATREATATYEFTEPGDYLVTLTVRDRDGAENSATRIIKVGNTAPLVRFLQPVDGGFFDWDEPVSYQVVVEDAEDGHSVEDGEVMKTRFLLTQSYHSASEDDAEAAHLGGAGGDTTALNLIRQSNCLNCHGLHNKIVGPAFVEIANRYADDEAALARSATRVITGSSQVWGEVPMPPHPQLSEAEARAMVGWILSLKDQTQKETATQSFTGTLRSVRPAWAEAHKAAVISRWEAAYTDFGAPGAGPLTTRVQVRLRPRQVEGEHCDRRQGTQGLNSPSASGGKFIGSISSGHHLVFEDLNLAGITQVTARVASPVTGGVVQLRQGAPDGDLVAEITFPATGEWEKWIEVSAPVKDPGGLHDLYCVFVRPEGSGPFMNLDWLRFEK